MKKLQTKNIISYRNRYQTRQTKTVSPRKSNRKRDKKEKLDLTKTSPKTSPRYHTFRYNDLMLKRDRLDKECCKNTAERRKKNQTTSQSQA